MHITSAIIVMTTKAKLKECGKKNKTKAWCSNCINKRLKSLRDPNIIETMLLVKDIGKAKPKIGITRCRMATILLYAAYITH